MAPDNKFKVLRKGKAVPTDNRPPDSLLEGLDPGDVVVGTDNVQWIVMAPQPKRFEKHKRPVKPAGAAAPTAPTATA